MGVPAMGLNVLEGIDILQTRVQQKLLAVILGKQVGYNHFGLPCSSWPRARRGNGGPGAIRSNSHVLGWPWLKGKDLEKVKVANRMVRIVAHLCRECMRFKVAWSVEIPRTSLAWSSPSLRRLASTPKAHYHYLDFCQLGTACRKSTTLLSHGIDLSPLSLRCRMRGGRCSATSKRHIILEGKASNGVWRTAQAQQYPQQLIEAWARLAKGFLSALRG